MTSRPASPAGSDSSTASRKRDRDNLSDEDATATLRSGKMRATKSSTATILEGINNITATLARHGELLKDIPIMKEQMDTFCKDVSELKKQFTIISADNTMLKQEIVDLKARVDNIQSGTLPQNISLDITRLEAATSSNAAHIQQALVRQNNIDELVISGFSLKQGQAHDLMALVQAVAKALKVNLASDNILSARLMLKSPRTDNDQSIPVQQSSAGVAQRTSIAVKCAHPNIVQKVLNAKRKRGTLKASDLGSDALTALNISEASNKDHNIYINELLPSHTYKLLGAARMNLKPLGFKYIWCRSGSIFAKLNKSAIIHTILTNTDLEKIQLMYSQSKV